MSLRQQLTLSFLLWEAKSLLAALLDRKLSNDLQQRYIQNKRTSDLEEKNLEEIILRFLSSLYFLCYFLEQRMEHSKRSTRLAAIQYCLFRHQRQDFDL
jgi:hypothetical protein